MSAVDRIADAVKDGQNPGAGLRIGKVLEVDIVTERARLDILPDTWLSYDVAASLAAGDRVYALMQGPTGVVAGKLSGSSGVPVGSLTAYAGLSATVPDGWMKCDGRLLSRTTYAVLFSRLGTSYGAGDGSTTFAIPNMSGRFPFGDDDSTTLGQTGGAKTVALSMAEMPSHNHGSDGAHTHTVPSGGSEVLGSTTATRSQPTVSDATTSSAGSHTHNTEGSGSAHENMPPWVALNYIIRVV